MTKASKKNEPRRSRYINGKTSTNRCSELPATYRPYIDRSYVWIHRTDESGLRSTNGRVSHARHILTVQDISMSEKRHSLHKLNEKRMRRIEHGRKIVSSDRQGCLESRATTTTRPHRNSGMTKTTAWRIALLSRERSNTTTTKTVRVCNEVKLTTRANEASAIDVKLCRQFRDDLKLRQHAGWRVNKDMTLLDDATPSTLTLNYHGLDSMGWL